MEKLKEIEERLYAPSLEYDLSFRHGEEAEKIFYDHAASDIRWLIEQVKVLKEENANLRKYLKEEMEKNE